MDQYRNFAELRNGETETTDYRICNTERESFAAVIAPHGGLIEPGTSQIAAAIAGNIHSLYCFEGLRKRPHRNLHIKSTNFDEPKCLDLIKRCKIVVAVHGLAGDHTGVGVGGRDVALRERHYAQRACHRAGRKRFPFLHDRTRPLRRVPRLSPFPARCPSRVGGRAASRP